MCKAQSTNRQPLARDGLRFVAFSTPIHKYILYCLWPENKNSKIYTSPQPMGLSLFAFSFLAKWVFTGSCWMMHSSPSNWLSKMCLSACKLVPFHAPFPSPSPCACSKVQPPDNATASRRVNWWVMLLKKGLWQKHWCWIAVFMEVWQPNCVLIIKPFSKTIKKAGALTFFIVLLVSYSVLAWLWCPLLAGCPFSNIEEALKWLMGPKR